ncbi:MAG: hypothetical protein CFE45_28025 [Burkholderiales bacterium PBB5]|nr:MAG: hypothetical protein CFE45_28025 [Burkholderiales bacterium PBB5]
MPSIIVRGNQVYGQGSGQCAGINLGSDAGGCDFSHNQCTRVVAPTTETLRPVVEITAGRIAASHNAVYGTSPSAATPIAAMSLWPTGNRYTVLGNLTSASTGAVSILVQGNALSGPWAPLNTLI